MPDEDMLETARKRYKDGVSWDRKNRDAAEVDYRYYAGDQWPDDVRREREEFGRPCLTVNRLPQFVRQVVNDARIKPPSIKVAPVDGGADKKMAEVYQGLIRNIEARSRASEAYIQALEHACIGGEGHFRVITQYTDDDAFDLDIAIRGIPSPMAVVWDFASRQPCREDAAWCFVTDLISRDEFQERYPKQTPSDWDSYQRQWEDWCEGNMVRIAEYWYRVPVTRRLLLTVRGETVDASTMTDEAIDQGYLAGEILRERTVETTKIMQCLLSADAVLEKPREWPGRHIPIVRVVGEEIHVGEQIIRRGLVRGARDAQWMYNLHRSSLAEAVAMAPKAKWVGTAAHFAGVEALWGAANRINQAYLIYNPDPEAPQGPQRVAPEVPAPALVQEVGLAAQDMEATIGIHRAGLGEESNERSGRAIIARQREGDVSTFNFADNLARGVEQCGRILVDLLPRIYDTPRVVRSLGEDGAEEFVQINRTDPATGEVQFDLSRGKYDVTVSIGPSYTTQREAARESMLAYMQAVPAHAAIMGDLFAEAMEWQGADEIAARLRKMLPPGLASPKEGDPPPQPQQPTPEQMIAQAELMKAQANAQRAQFEAAIKVAELELEKVKLAQQGVRITDQGNADAAKALTGLLKVVQPPPAPAGPPAG